MTPLPPIDTGLLLSRRELFEAGRSDLGPAPLLGAALIGLLALWLASKRKESQ